METPKKALLVHLFAPTVSTEAARADATEMFYLVSSLGGVTVVDMITQRGYPAKEAYIGHGKAQEVARKVADNDIDIVVINGHAKSRQLFALSTALQKEKRDVEVWDRVDLILHIFSKHARTAEAKLQIELARMRHMGPRIYGMGHVLSQQGGGIGGRGIGETNVELMKRHWRDAMRAKRRELQELKAQRERQILNRKEMGLPTLSIVGYTNAGKTSLFNRLTKKTNYADNLLFATLDSTVGKVYLPGSQQEAFVSDTIGFIKNLPPNLVEAFGSTLLESVHADIILHVLDGSNPSVFDQFHVVEDVLAKIGLGEKDEIVVVNKSDTAPKKLLEEIMTRLHLAQPITISAQTGEGIDTLLREMEARLGQQHTPQHQQKRHITIHDEPGHAPSGVVLREKRTVVSKATWLPGRIPNRDELSVGKHVLIVAKSSQKTGEATSGNIKRILSHNFSHPHGIKVELDNGTVGRVKQLLS